MAHLGHINIAGKHGVRSALRATGCTLKNTSQRRNANPLRQADALHRIAPLRRISEYRLETYRLLWALRDLHYMLDSRAEIIGNTSPKEMRKSRFRVGAPGRGAMGTAYAKPAPVLEILSLLDAISRNRFSGNIAGELGEIREMLGRGYIGSMGADSLVLQGRLNVSLRVVRNAKGRVLRIVGEIDETEEELAVCCESQGETFQKYEMLNRKIGEMTNLANTAKRTIMHAVAAHREGRKNVQELRTKGSALAEGMETSSAFMDELRGLLPGLDGALNGMGGAIEALGTPESAIDPRSFLGKPEKRALIGNAMNAIKRLDAIVSEALECCEGAIGAFYAAGGMEETDGGKPAGGAQVIPLHKG